MHEGERLVIDPKHFKAAELMMIGKEEEEPEAAPAEIRNWVWSYKRRGEILIWEEDGKIVWGFVPGANHFGMDISALGASVAWGIEQEGNAVKLLGTLLRHHAFKQYLLTGMFLETSPRSGITYLFRKLKPTIALTLKEQKTRILAALCLHPIAYYEGTWAGAMCPTDDVVAHLMLMRGDEKLFWRRANQHAAYRPEAGL